MIRHFIKKAAVALTAAAIIISASTVMAGANQIPDTIRVGLYYKDTSVNTAQSIFDVSADDGIQAGFNLDGDFVEIYKEPGSSPLLIRKDAYYYDGGSGLKEYSPSSPPSSGAKYGPYHIKIGNDHPDASSAGTQASAYAQAGVQAYIVYDDAWQVWAGSYPDDASAQAELSNLADFLGEEGFSVIQPSNNRIVVMNSQFQIMCIFGGSTSYLQLRAAPENEPAVISIKGKQYRGALEIKRLSNSDMTVINVVTIQEYLYGNVPPEIGGKSPAEALKAQAVASKMYAVNNAGKHGKTGFDVCATTHCQVYKGYSSEIPQCNNAIDEVKDKIITYDGNPATQIYYFASGGGSTEDVRNVWGSTYPYLVSVEDKYEKIYTWTKTLRASDVKAKLPQLGSILGISITRTAQTGRVTQLAITGTSRGEPLYYSNEKSRTLFGLDSQLYTITTDADVFAAALGDPAGIESAGAEKNKDASMNGQNTAAVQPPAFASTDAELMSAADTAAANPADIDKDDDKEMMEQAQPDQTKEPAEPKPTMPFISKPVRTQLAGKKVITADGVMTLGGSKNKIAILGANGSKNSASVVPETYTFTGKGWGHAVGMSQEGAIGMGKAGLTYDAILTHYFQGTKIE